MSGLVVMRKGKIKRELCSQPTIPLILTNKRMIDGVESQEIEVYTRLFSNFPPFLSTVKPTCYVPHMPFAIITKPSETRAAANHLTPFPGGERPEPGSCSRLPRNRIRGPGVLFRASDYSTHDSLRTPKMKSWKGFQRSSISENG